VYIDPERGYAIQVSLALDVDHVMAFSPFDDNLGLRLPILLLREWMPEIAFVELLEIRCGKGVHGAILPLIRKFPPLG
jgi:hypothetical protein